MDKNAIKKFAVWARRELIARVGQRAAWYGITEKDPIDEKATVIHDVVLTDEEQAQRRALIARIHRAGYQQVMEEVAYTWFNRFIALRFMEVNGYLPSYVRVFSDENGAFNPQILAEAIHLQLEGLDMEKVYALEEANEKEALFKYLVIAQCNDLNRMLPGMFQKIADYTELLFPDYLLRSGSVVEQMVTTIPEDDWKDAVQIIGWLYQYYNAEPKDEVFAALKKNIKISKEKIPAATQLFTPDWIVRYMVENSLGRLWVEGHPNDELKAGWKYYLEEAPQEPEVEKQLAVIRQEYAQLDPASLLCADPCMGSGHILVYMFDVLMQIYLSYGYTTNEAVESIVRNNLWGMDIDDRAAQLAYFAVMMKAQQYDKRWLAKQVRHPVQPNVFALQDSGDWPTFERRMRAAFTHHPSLFAEPAIKTAKALFDAFADAKEFGSIIQPEVTLEELNMLETTLDEMSQKADLMDFVAQADANTLLETLKPLILQTRGLVQKYHAVVTNPPYLGIKSVKESMAEYLSIHYADTKFDVACSFVERMRTMIRNNFYFSAIVPQAMSFAPTFSELRNRLITTTTIVSFNQLGLGVFGSDRGTVSFINRLGIIPKYLSRGLTLESTKESDEKALLLASIHDGVNSSLVYTHDQFIFTKIPNSPIGFTCSTKLLSLYSKVGKITDHGMTRQGLATSDNDRFARLWHEVPFDNICFNAQNAHAALSSNKRWFPFNKGGGTRRWYGNLDYVVDWSNDGKEMKDLATSLYKSYSRTIKNESLYFKRSITWSDIGTVFSGREYPQGGIFSTVGLCMFTEDSLFNQMLGYMNSKVTLRLLTALNPTIHFNVGDIALLPYLPTKNQFVEELVRTNICHAKDEWDSFETSWDFQHHPIIWLSHGLWDSTLTAGNLQEFYGEVPQSSCPLETCYLLWQGICNRRFNQLKTNEEELNRIFIDIYGLQDELTPEVADKDVTVRKADLGRDIRSLISYAVGCIMGRYSLDKPGLILAGQRFGDVYAHDPEGYQYGDLTILKGDYLVNDAEKKDYTKCSFAPDRDGILPITDDEYFDDDIVGMFVEWVRTVFGADSLEDNLKYIAKALGGSGAPRDALRQYFLNDFYKDHLKVYQKRPIYWLFDSGKKNGFKCLIYMHRYQPDTIARIRTDYVHETQARYRTAIETLERQSTNASTGERVKLQKRLTALKAQAEELRVYEEKIHHLADQMIPIDLDDGVKVNYAKFADVLAPIK